MHAMLAADVALSVHLLLKAHILKFWCAKREVLQRLLVAAAYYLQFFLVPCCKVLNIRYHVHTLWLLVYHNGNCYFCSADLSTAFRHSGLCLNGGELQLLAREWPTVHSDQVDVLALVQAIEKAFCTEF